MPSQPNKKQCTIENQVGEVEDPPPPMTEFPAEVWELILSHLYNALLARDTKQAGYLDQHRVNSEEWLATIADVGEHWRTNQNIATNVRMSFTNYMWYMGALSAAQYHLPVNVAVAHLLVMGGDGVGVGYPPTESDSDDGEY